MKDIAAVVPLLFVAAVFVGVCISVLRATDWKPRVDRRAGAAGRSPAQQANPAPPAAPATKATDGAPATDAESGDISAADHANRSNSGTATEDNPQ